MINLKSWINFKKIRKNRQRFSIESATKIVEGKAKTPRVLGMNYHKKLLEAEENKKSMLQENEYDLDKRVLSAEDKFSSQFDTSRGMDYVPDFDDDADEDKTVSYVSDVYGINVY